MHNTTLTIGTRKRSVAMQYNTCSHHTLLINNEQNIQSEVTLIRWFQKNMIYPHKQIV